MNAPYGGNYGEGTKGKEPKGDGRVNKGHFFQPGHLLARLTGVGGAAAASSSHEGHELDVAARAFFKTLYSRRDRAALRLHRHS